MGWNMGECCASSLASGSFCHIRGNEEVSLGESWQGTAPLQHVLGGCNGAGTAHAGGDGLIAAVFVAVDSLIQLNSWVPPCDFVHSQGFPRETPSNQLI